MNLNERQPIHSQELLGRMEEQHTFVEYLTQDFNEKGEKVEERLEKVGDEILDGEVGDLMGALNKLATHTESTRWILALRRTGVSDEDIIKIWDLKIKLGEDASSGDTNP